MSMFGENPGYLGQIPLSEMFVSKPPTLTLRDYLIGQALAGLLAAQANRQEDHPLTVWGDKDKFQFAEIVCEFADACLEARKTQESSPAASSGNMCPQDIITKAQSILAEYLVPDGIDGEEAINQLLSLLDGPECREAMGQSND